jgi:hypothetical protein
VLPSGKKIILALLVTIALPCFCTVPSTCHFLNASWKPCIMRVFRACDSASITLIVSKWQPFSFVFNQGNRESRVGRGWQSPFFLNSLVKKKLWDGDLSWYNSHFFCRQSSRRSLRTYSHICHKIHSSMRELTVWPARTNSLWTIPLTTKKIMSMLLTYPTFFDLGEFGLMLSSPNVCLIIARDPLHFFRDLYKIWCTLAVEAIPKLRQTRYTTPKKGTKNSPHSSGCMKFCTLAPKTC